LSLVFLLHKHGLKEQVIPIVQNDLLAVYDLKGYREVEELLSDAAGSRELHQSLLDLLIQKQGHEMWWLLEQDWERTKRGLQRLFPVTDRALDPGVPDQDPALGPPALDLGPYVQAAFAHKDLDEEVQAPVIKEIVQHLVIIESRIGALPNLFQAGQGAIRALSDRIALEASALEQQDGPSSVRQALFSSLLGSLRAAIGVPFSDDMGDQLHV
jgi:hypothetical protein